MKYNWSILWKTNEQTKKENQYFYLQDINPALFVLDDEVVEFWKSLKDMKKKKHGFQLSPLDIIKYFKGHLITINSSFADKVRHFIVKAIHIQVNGMKKGRVIEGERREKWLTYIQAG